MGLPRYANLLIQRRGLWMQMPDHWHCRMYVQPLSFQEAAKFLGYQNSGIRYLQEAQPNCGCSTIVKVTMAAMSADAEYRSYKSALQELAGVANLDCCRPPVNIYLGSCKHGFRLLKHLLHFLQVMSSILAWLLVPNNTRALDSFESDTMTDIFPPYNTRASWKVEKPSIAPRLYHSRKGPKARTWTYHEVCNFHI